MKPAAKPACPRLFEAEALRDGRLTGADVARFQAHLGICAVCAHEVQAMQALADALRSPESSRGADELHVRRERTRLLAAFDASLVPAQRVRGPRWVAAAAALVALATLGLAFWRARPLTPAVAALEPVSVRADGSAKWTRQTAARRETLVLESGTLSIHVDHALPHRNLLVVLPDGELEDIGTTFSVSAEAGQTTRVAVQDGSVVLHLRELPALTLRAGDAWSRAATPVAAPPPPVAAPLANLPATPSAHGVKPPFPAPPASSIAASASASATDAAADFRAAMSALNAGDNGHASALFAAFLAQHPRDARAEDAAYLRVLALQRTGNAASTKQAATDYLSRYPHGFRHAEIELLSR